MVEIISQLFKKKEQHPYVGHRVKCIIMVDEPYPVPSETMGTIVHVGGDVINVKWDNGRNIGLIMGVDKYVIYDKENCIIEN